MGGEGKKCDVKSIGRKDSFEIAHNCAYIEKKKNSQETVNIYLLGANNILTLLDTSDIFHVRKHTFS